MPREKIMGVQTHLTLTQANCLFASYHFTQLTPTRNGVMDTTYIAHTEDSSYILKRYERDIHTKVFHDAQRLNTLYNAGLRVPRVLCASSGWYLYEKLPGEHPKNTTLKHMQALARFLGKLHTQTRNTPTQTCFSQNYPLNTLLRELKQNYFSFYKKLQHLHNYTQNNDGFIHGDIFKDNCVFDNGKLGVFDFIDGGGGSFAFDCGVALSAFAPKTRRTMYAKYFLGIYNQHAPKKLSQQELLQAMVEARSFYALLRVHHFKNTQRAKEFLS